MSAVWRSGYRRSAGCSAPLLSIGLGFTACLALFGCQSQQHWQAAAAKLDAVAAGVDEFGTVTVSEAQLVKDTGQFSLGDKFNRPVNEYVDAARSGVQGAARRSQEQALDVSQKLQVRADITSIFNPLLAAGAAVPAPPTTAPSVDVTLPTDRPAKGTLSSSMFSKPQDLGQLSGGLSERQAMLVGVNDKVTEGLLKFLVNPGDSIPENKKVYIGVLQVSCQPGWRTRKGYIADVNVAVSYAREDDPKCKKQSKQEGPAGAGGAGDSGGAVTEPAGQDPQASAEGVGVKGTINGTGFTSSLSVPGRAQPFVVAAFPSVEAQTLDLRNSIRSQIAFANQLALVLKAGAADAQAQQLIDFAKRLENDFASRNPIPILTSYSNGASFGYQLRPAFQALENPSSKSSGAGEVLNPSSFPALILVVCDKCEIEQGKWTHIEMLVSSRWIPADPSSRNHRLTETHRLEQARFMDEAMTEFREAVSPRSTELGATHAEAISSYRAQELKRRIRLYEFAGVGITRYSELPEETKQAGPLAPQITAVQPPVGWKNDQTVLAVSGAGFTDGKTPIVKRVAVGGIDCDFMVAGSNALVAVVPSGAYDTGRGKPPGPAQSVTVVTTKGVAVSGAVNAVTFSNERDDAPTTTKPTIALQRDALGRVTSIIISGDDKVSSADLLTAIRSILEHETCWDDVAVQINGAQVNVAPGKGSHGRSATQPADGAGNGTR